MAGAGAGSSSIAGRGALPSTRALQFYRYATIFGRLCLFIFPLSCFSPGRLCWEKRPKTGISLREQKNVESLDSAYDIIACVASRVGALRGNQVVRSQAR